MNDNVDIFRVIEHDDHGAPARCSYCPREVKRVVVVPLEHRLDQPEQRRSVDSGDLWLGLCAYCVLEMARALARAEGKLP